jgi:quercetin dioxygenase-like cupin family protein
VASIESKSFDRPDETKELDKTTIELVDLAGGQVQRTTFQPGWRWTESVGPAMHADRCSVNHLAYVVSGRLRAEHDDGSVGEVKPGDVLHLAPGHDAWVVGDEPVVLIEFQGLIRPAAS